MQSRSISRELALLILGQVSDKDMKKVVDQVEDPVDVLAS